MPYFKDDKSRENYSEYDLFQEWMLLNMQAQRAEIFVAIDIKRDTRVAVHRNIVIVRHLFVIIYNLFFFPTPQILFTFADR